MFSVVAACTRSAESCSQLNDLALAVMGIMALIIVIGGLVFTVFGFLDNW